MTNRTRLFVIGAMAVIVLVVVGGIVYLLKTNSEFAGIFSGFLLILLVLAGVSFNGEMRRREELAREREIANLTAQALAEQLGPHVDLLSRAAAESENGMDSVTVRSQPDESIQQEVDRRVDEASRRLKEIVAAELADARRASSVVLDSRMKAIEEKFPPETEAFQKYSDANQLFLAYKLSALSKRIDKVEERLPTRAQVVGIVVTTLGVAVGLLAGLFGILRTLGLMH